MMSTFAQIVSLLAARTGGDHPAPPPASYLVTPSPPRSRGPPLLIVSHLSSDVCVCVPPAGVLRERRTIAPPSYLAIEADETSEELSSMKRSSRGKKSDRALREESDKALRCRAIPMPGGDPPWHLHCCLSA
jgi:hypothetical protein